eukprot:6203175-Pleurochrysis_carterae.AAC.2
MTAKPSPVTPSDASTSPTASRAAARADRAPVGTLQRLRGVWHRHRAISRAQRARWRASTDSMCYRYATPWMRGLCLLGRGAARKITSFPILTFASHAYLRSARAPLSEFWSPRGAHGRPCLSAPDPEPPRRRAQPLRPRSLPRP